jgi:protocatechuate 3,4-dioxygenase beta subunit
MRTSRRRTLEYFGATGVLSLAACGRSTLRSDGEEELGAGGEMSDGIAGNAGTAGVAGTSGAAGKGALCVVRPEQTEGPYFSDELLLRSDIRSDPLSGAVKDGVPLDVTFRVYDASGGACVPILGARVDLWQCDAAGVYSDVSALGTGDQLFLRGFQVTDTTGTAAFVSIFPGWYPGRTLHAHFKVRLVDAVGVTRAFTSQFYFEEAVNEAVMALAPYAARGPRQVTNAADGIFRAGGSELMLPLTRTEAGYAGVFEMGLILG